MQVAHPVAKQWNLLDFFLGNVTGYTGYLRVSDYNIKETAMIADIEDRGVCRYIFQAYESNFSTCKEKDNAESPVDNCQRGTVFHTWIEFTNNPFYEHNGDTEYQK